MIHSSIACDTETATVPQLFRQTAAEYYAKEAILFEDQELSYAQLNALANRFANALVTQGIAPGDRVGLCIDRSPEAIAAMLGVFKAGAAFVPLDPEYPIDRIRFMIEDASIKVIITNDKQSNAQANAIEKALHLTWIDSADNEFALQSDAFEDHSVKPTDLAYIMYTSGSTGIPKGVQIEHRALTTYCMADIETYQLSVNDRTLQFSTLNFDIAIEEIFPPLLIGSCVVVRPRERASDANELSAIIRSYDVSAIHLATAYWHEWVDLMVATGDRVPDTLRLVIATGEKVSVEHYRRWLNQTDHEILWCNAYGPTETTVTATVFVPDANFDGDNMPIGKPLPGYSAWILDEQLTPVQPGETGQLFIGGPALAKGYLNRPDRNAQAFVEVDLPEQGRERLYRTGDLARWLPDGNIDFAGRIDHQIKLGSYRIEPGEIEAAVNKHPCVLESLITYDTVEQQKYLIAYVAHGENSVSIEELVDYLRDSLPGHMVPTRYVLLHRLPKTINGKIDREALPAADTSQTAESDKYAPPRDQLESQLADTWARVLNLPKVGIQDDFFALGGSSLLVTRIVTELTSLYGIELPVRDFFANPTIASCARHLRRLLELEPLFVAEDEHKELQRAREQHPVLSPQFIGSDDRRIFSMHYQPTNKVKAKGHDQRHGVVMCNALGHEYTRAYRNLQQLALLLCAKGFDVLRFDYFGTGNSAGECSDFRVESLQSDIRRAVEFLRTKTQVESLTVIGVRMGATLAATTEFDRAPDQIVLWDPVAQGQQFLETTETFHSYALTSQTRYASVMQDGRTEQLFGHPFNAEKRSSLSRLRLPKQHKISRNLVITSSNYLTHEVGLGSATAKWNVAETDDEIYWHRPEFSESAFSSPAAFRDILSFLENGQSGVKSHA